jgi:hypothetical protein
MGFNRDLSCEQGDGTEAGRAVDDGAVGRSGVDVDVEAAAVPPGSLNDHGPFPTAGEATTYTVLNTPNATTAVSMANGPDAATTSVPGIGGKPLGISAGQQTLTSWKVAGSSRGTGMMKQRMFMGGSRGRLRGVGIAGRFGIGMGRVTQKASRKTSLPSVMDSPVKGGSKDDFNEGGGEESGQPRNEDAAMAVPGDESTTTDTEVWKGKEKEKPTDAWRNVSWRASLASQALSQSLSSLPVPPPKTKLGNMGPPATPAGKPGDVGISSHPEVSSSGTKVGPLRSSARILAMAGPRSAPGALNKVKGGEGGHVSSGRKGEKAEKAEGTLGVMKNCTVFVDVRTDDGDDAGDLFVQMLRDLGAKVSMYSLCRALFTFCLLIFIDSNTRRADMHTHCL